MYIGRDPPACRRRCSCRRRCEPGDRSRSPNPSAPGDPNGRDAAARNAAGSDRSRAARLRWALAPWLRPPPVPRGVGAAWRSRLDPRRDVAHEGGHRIRVLGHALHGRLDAGLAHEQREVLLLGGEHEGDDVALAAGASRAAGAVQVRLVLHRRVDVHDQLDVVDVHAASGDIGRDENACGARRERGEVAVALRLGEVAVQVDRRDAGRGELLGELLGVVLGAHEQDAAAGARRERVDELLLRLGVVGAKTWWVIAATGEFASSTSWSTGLCRN